MVLKNLEEKEQYEFLRILAFVCSRALDIERYDIEHALRVSGMQEGARRECIKTIKQLRSVKDRFDDLREKEWGDLDL